MCKDLLLKIRLGWSSFTSPKRAGRDLLIGQVKSTSAPKTGPSCPSDATLAKHEAATRVILHQFIASRSRKSITRLPDWTPAAGAFWRWALNQALGQTLGTAWDIGCLTRMDPLTPGGRRLALLADEAQSRLGDTP